MRAAKSLPFIFIIAIVAVISTFLLSSYVEGSISCTFNSTMSCGTDTKYLGLENDTGGYDNAHVQKWWNSDWLARKKITFNNTASVENLTNFPILVILNSSNIDYTKTQNSGEDLRFVDDDNYEQLDHEIELWNETGNSYVWVRVRQIDAASSNDYIFMYFNNTAVSDGQNATGVWSDNFDGVWHLGENPSDARPEYKDSTANDHDGNETSVARNSSGAIGKGIQLLNNDDKIDIGNRTSISYSTDHLTISAWVNGKIPTNSVTTYYIVRKLNNGGLEFGVYDGRIYFDTWDGGAGSGTVRGPILSNDNWHFVTGGRNSSHSYIFVNGTLYNTTSATTFDINDTSNFTIGNSIAGSQAWNGTLDEIRIARINRSTNYIHAQYLTQSNQFNTFSAEQTQYANSLCCSTTLPETLAYDCTDTNLLDISDDDNAHVQNNTIGTYNVDVCMSLAPSNASCVYTTSSCPSNHNCLLSMSAMDNAHVASCGVYSVSLCCRAIEITVCVNETGSCFETVQEAVNDATAGQTVVITDNKVYNEQVTITGKDGLKLTSNGTGFPTITFSNASVIRPNSNHLIIEKLNVNYTNRDGDTEGAIGPSGGSAMHNAIVRHINLTVTSNYSNNQYGVYFSGFNVTFQYMNITMNGGRASLYHDDSRHTVDVEHVVVNTNGSTQRGMFLSGQNISLYAVEIYGGTLHALSLSTAENVNITNSIIFGNGDSSVDGLSYGTAPMDRVIILNTTINATAIAIDSQGEDWLIVDSELYSTDRNVNTYNEAENWTFINVTFNNTVRLDSFDTTTGVHNISFYNTTIDPSLVEYAACDGANDRCEAKFYSYLDVYVNASSTNPISGANVTIHNVSNIIIESELTGSNGYITTKNISYANATNRGSTVVTWYTNHTINASAAGYNMVNKSVNMTASQLVFLTLPEILSVCVNETGSCWSNLTDAVNNATSGQTVVIIDNRVYYETLSITKNLNITSNGTGRPTIFGVNATTITTNDATLRFRKINLSGNGTADDLEVIAGTGNTDIQLYQSGLWMDYNGSGTRGIYISSGTSRITIDHTNITSRNSSQFLQDNFGNFLRVNHTRILGTFRQSIGTIQAQGGSSIADIQNTFINSSSNGLTLSGSSQSKTIKNTTIYASGSSASFGAYATITGSYFNTTGSQSAITMGTNITITNSIIAGTGSAVCIDTYSTVNIYHEIRDSEVKGTCVTGRLYINAAGANTTHHVALYNVTGLTPDEITFNGCGNDNCTATHVSYLDIYVNDSLGNTVSGADVNISNVTGTQILYNVTNALGRTDTLNVTSLVQFHNGTLYQNWHTNHTINVSTNLHNMTSATFNLTLTKLVNITLSAPDTVCVNETQICWPTVQQAIDNATTGQIVVITDARAYQENISIDKNIIITSNGSGKPTIHQINISTILLTDSVNISNVILNVSGNQSGMAVIDATITGEEVRIMNSIINVNGRSDVFALGIDGISVGGGGNNLFVIDRTNFTGGEASTIIDFTAPADLSLNNSRFEGDFEFAIWSQAVAAGPVNISNTFINHTYVDSSSCCGNIVGLRASNENSFIDNLTIYTITDGTAIEISSNTEVTNLFVNRSGGGSSIVGASFSGTNVSVVDSTIVSDRYCYQFIPSVDPTLEYDIRDSSCTSSWSTPVYLRGSVNYSVIFTNVSGAQPHDVIYGDSCTGSANFCNATFVSYLDVYVNDSLGNDIVGMNVTVYNVSNQTVAFNLTNANGRISRQNITYAFQWNNGATITYWFTNHTINLTSTAFGNATRSVNMSVSRLENFTLTAPNSVCIQETGVCWQTVGLAEDNATAGQTIVITDGRIYNESVSITKDITITSNGSSIPTIYATDKNTITTGSGIEVNMSLLNLSLHSRFNNTWLLTASSGSVGDTRLTDMSIWIDHNGSNGGLFLLTNDFTFNRVNVTSVDSNFLIRYGSSADVIINNSRIEGPSSFPLSQSASNSLTVQNTFMNSTGDVNGNNDVTIINSSMYANQFTFGHRTRITSSTLNSTNTLGLGIQNDSIIYGSTLEAVNYPVYTNTVGWNVTIIDTNATGSVGDLLMSDSTGYHNVTVVNSTIQPHEVAYIGCGASDICAITFKSYLTVRVNDTVDNPVVGANVSIYNVTPTYVDSLLTGTSGFTSLFNITYATQTGNGSTITTWITNHSMNVTTTTHGNTSRFVNMSVTRAENFTLTAPNTVCVNETGVCWQTIAEAITNATDDQTVVILDGRTYYENLTIDKDLLLTSNGTSTPTILTTNENTFTIGTGQNVNMSRINISLQETSNSTAVIVDAVNGATMRFSNMNVWINSSSGADALYLFSGEYDLDRVNITSIDSDYPILYFGSNLTVNYSRIEGNSSNAIRTTGGAKAAIHNTFMNITSGQGIVSDNYPVEVRNLTIYTANANALRLGFKAKIIDSTANVTSNSATAAIVRNHSIIVGSTLSGFQAIDTYNEGYNITVIDTEAISSSSDLRVNSQDNSAGTHNITVINSTIQPEDVTYTGCLATEICAVKFKSYLTVYTNDTGGSDVSGANVTVYNFTNDTVQSLITAANGYTGLFNITYATQTGNASTLTIWKTNHTINVTHSLGNATREVNMSITRIENFTLTAPLNVCINETGVCWATIAQAITNATHQETVVIIDGRTYVEQLTINKNITLTSNGSSRPTIHYREGTVITVNANIGANITRVNISLNADTQSNLKSVLSNAAELRIANTNIWVNGSGSNVEGSDFRTNGITEVVRVNYTCLTCDNIISYHNTDTHLTINHSRLEGNFSGRALITSSNAEAYIHNTFVNGTHTSGIGFTANAPLVLHNATVTTYQFGVSPTGASTIIRDSDITAINQAALRLNDNVRVERSTITGGPTLAIDTAQTGNNITIVDSTISSSGAIRIDLTSNGAAFVHNITIINSTILPHEVSYNNCLSNETCSVEFISYLDIYVDRTGGFPLNTVTVNISNVTGDLLSSLSTGTNGRIVRQNVTYATQNSTETLWKTNHTFNLTFAGYDQADNSTNMSVYRFLNFTLAASAPSIPTLLLPADNDSTVFARYTFFDWTDSTDEGGHSIYYLLNISAPAGCAAIPVQNITSSQYTSSTELCTDNTYNWTVRACDSNQFCSNWTTQFNFSIGSVIDINFTTNSTNFGSMATSTPVLNITNNTLNNDPDPLILKNIGNVDINADLRGTVSLWSSQSMGTEYWRYGKTSRNTTGNVSHFQKISNTSGNFSQTFVDGDDFGIAIASLSDLNNDGVPDLVVGAPGVDDGGSGAGAIYILFMNRNGTVESHTEINNASFSNGNITANDRFGTGVANLSDIDGDGIEDIAVGANTADNLAGELFIIMLNANGTVKNFTKITNSTLGGALEVADLFGADVTGLGDLNGDGVGDVAVGAGDDDDGGGERGAVYILFLNSDGTLNSSQKISSTSGNFSVTLENDDQFGYSVANIGDLNNDGITDIATGARNDETGAVHILFLNSNGTVKNSTKINESNLQYSFDSEFGFRIVGPGDLNGDGVEDIVVGERGNDDGGTDRGAIYTIFMNADGTVNGSQKTSDTTGTMNVSLDDADYFASVTAAVDLDEDGVKEIMVGAYLDDDGATVANRGAVYVMYMEPDVAWLNVSVGYQNLTDDLEWDYSVGVEIDIRVPQGEPSGSKSGTVMALAESAE